MFCIGQKKHLEYMNALDIVLIVYIAMVLPKGDASQSELTSTQYKTDGKR